jgi:hypothetical protein
VLGGEADAEVIGDAPLAAGAAPLDDGGALGASPPLGGLEHPVASALASTTASATLRLDREGTVSNTGIWLT